jgi:hypothetical protein
MARMRVSARAVDMLGRQQIAGLPTAISELFKNAHDAYAKRVEVDYYHVDRLFVLRDDGLGMTRDEFEERWLTLGTDSKMVLPGSIPLPPSDPAQPSRPILGEKGIGRLASAAIGDCLLILTRPKAIAEREVSDRIVVALIHWGVFSLPGIDLSEIDIPIRDFANADLPNEADVRGMTRAIDHNLKRILRGRDVPASAPIFKSLESFTVDPRKIAGFLPTGPNLAGPDGCGTWFIIRPAEHTLEDDLRTANDDTASPLEKVLIGFTNTMTPGAPRPRIVGAFREHKTDGVVDDCIGSKAFFEPTEFEEADHHFRGDFDGYGQFSGTVTVYRDPKPYVVGWKGSDGVRTKCGPFSIDIAYIQGTKRESMLPPDEHARMIAKLNRIGGLYIYRDGIRILPYGDSDYDFLDIEKRRTKSAGYYFFSYRRIFGVIAITRKQNSGLVEKAGREGFRQDKAYRQFRDILENFVVQVAADFFREGGDHAEMYSKRREELDRKERLKRQREKEARVRREAFRKELSAFFEAVEAGRPRERVGVRKASLPRC